jgi:uncharacterized Zn finger protein (UPF0148 family)
MKGLGALPLRGGVGMKVAKIACVKCGSHSLRDDDGYLRCAQCGRAQEEKRPAMTPEAFREDRRSKWDASRR